jgi:hypothetical protein
VRLDRMAMESMARVARGDTVILAENGSNDRKITV